MCTLYAGVCIKKAIRNQIVISDRKREEKNEGNGNGKMKNGRQTDRRMTGVRQELFGLRPFSHIASHICIVPILHEIAEKSKPRRVENAAGQTNSFVKNIQNGLFAFVQE